MNLWIKCEDIEWEKDFQGPKSIDKIVIPDEIIMNNECEDYDIGLSIAIHNNLWERYGKKCQVKSYSVYNSAKCEQFDLELLLSAI